MAHQYPVDSKYILEILRFDSIETTQLVSISFDVSISLEYLMAYKQNPVQT